MEKKIIVINGTGGSGKDTFVKYVAECAEVINFSSIDKTREVVKWAMDTYCGYNGDYVEEKTEAYRKLLSENKRITREWFDGPFKEITSVIKDFLESEHEIMFIHSREADEIKRIVDNFGALTLLVKRAGLENINSNASDANVDNYDYDIVIINDDLDQLRSDAEVLVNDLRGNKVKRK